MKRDKDEGSRKRKAKIEKKGGRKMKIAVSKGTNVRIRAERREK